MRIIDHILLDTTNVHAETDTSSVQVTSVWGFSMHIVYTGDGIGAEADIQLQASNDNENWSDLGAASNISGTSGNLLINVAEPYYKYTRVKIKNVLSNLTTVKIYMYAKGTS